MQTSWKRWKKRPGAAGRRRWARRPPRRLRGQHAKGGKLNGPRASGSTLCFDEGSSRSRHGRSSTGRFFEVEVRHWRGNKDPRRRVVHRGRGKFNGGGWCSCSPRISPGLSEDLFRGGPTQKRILKIQRRLMKLGRPRWIGPLRRPAGARIPGGRESLGRLCRDLFRERDGLGGSSRDQA